MAAQKIIATKTLQMKIKSGEDKNGNAVYKKKSFSGVRVDAEPQPIYDVAEAIKECLDVSVSGMYIAESYELRDDGNNPKEPESIA